MSDTTNAERDAATGPARHVRVFWPEVAVALVLLALAAVVVVDSLRVGVGWAEDGPRSGAFPFWIGALLAACSAWILFGALRGTARDAIFAEREQLVRVAAMLVPIAAYVAAIGPLGIYVASALLIAWFMLRHGGRPEDGAGRGRRAVAVPAIALGVPLAAFLVFERWFLVPLPKGPLERLLGF